MATIYEVSKLAGVSLATVSRVMNDNSGVREKTREKVLAAMKALDYQPNSMAQSLASNRTNAIGILVSELHGPFYGEMMSGIERELRRAKKHTIIAAGHSREESEREGIEFLISRNCDALILHVEAVSDDYLKRLNDKLPIILLNRYIADLAPQCISLNNHHGGELAARSILSRGHHEIGYISGPLWKRDAQDRLAGFKDVLQNHNITLSAERLYEGDYQEQGGYDGATTLLRNNTDLTAIVCANDEMAAGAMNAVRDHQLQIPDHISIFGFDNMIVAQYLYPKLSTIDYPVRSMGEMAARLVLERVYECNTGPITNIFKPVCINRDSVRSLANVSLAG